MGGSDDLTAMNDPDFLAEYGQRARRARGADRTYAEADRGIRQEGGREMGNGQLGILTLPRLLAVEVLLAEPEALQDDVLESCLYILRGRLRGEDGDAGVKLRLPAALARQTWPLPWRGASRQRVPSRSARRSRVAGTLACRRPGCFRAARQSAARLLPVGPRPARCACRSRADGF